MTQDGSLELAGETVFTHKLQDDQLCSYIFERKSRPPDQAKEFLAQKGFDINYGARPLRRALQKYLEDPLADEILKGQFAGDCEVLVDKEQEEKLSFKVVVGAHPLQSKEFVA